MLYTRLRNSDQLWMLILSVLSVFSHAGSIPEDHWSAHEMGELRDNNQYPNEILSSDSTRHRLSIDNTKRTVRRGYVTQRRHMPGSLWRWPPNWRLLLHYYHDMRAKRDDLGW
ncbi:unnamed protein product [Dicrocoelium dendriticum]|nr:unnamed protein product [Dicrocoelium dendriticum]